MLTTRISNKAEVASSSSRNILPVGYNDSKGYHQHMHKNDKSAFKQVWTMLLYIITAALFFQFGYFFMQYSTADVSGNPHIINTALSDTAINGISNDIKDTSSNIPGVNTIVKNIGINGAKSNDVVDIDSANKPLIDTTTASSSTINNVVNQKSQGTSFAFLCYWLLIHSLFESKTIWVVCALLLANSNH